MFTLGQDIDLKLLESKLEEEAYLIVEEIIDKNGILRLANLGKGNWESLVVDNGMRHTLRLNLKSNKIKRSLCSCPHDQSKGICPHVGAAALMLRKELQEKKEKTTNTTSRRRSSKSFDLVALLHNLSKEEIDGFVLRKARKDKNFRLLLQASFIKKISSDQLESFVESTFPVLTKANEKIPASKLKAYIDISEELVKHFKNLVALDNLTEAYELIFLLLRKSFYVKHHLKNEPPRFYKMHKNLLTDFNSLYSLIEAPEYRHKITSHVDQLLSTSYISAELKEEQELWMIQYKHHASPSTLMSITQEYLAKYRQDFGSYYFIKSLQLLLISDLERRKDIITSLDSQERYRIIQHLSAQKNHPTTHEVMFDFLQHTELSHPLAKAILENLDLPDKKEVVIKRASHYLIKYKEEYYIRYIRDNSENWENDLSEILLGFESINDVKSMIRVLLMSEKHDDALTLLQRHLSWDLLTEFDREISITHPDSCLALYKEVITTYVNHHFGIHAQDFVRHAMSRLSNLDRKDWSNNIREYLKENYSDRRALWA